MRAGMKAVLIAGIVGVWLTGCGSSSHSTASSSSSVATSTTTATQTDAQHRAEAIFERRVIPAYVRGLKPGSVRISSPCSRAFKADANGQKSPIPGTWLCGAWGLVAAGEPGAGKCEFIEAKVTAAGIVGTLQHEAIEFAQSSCQLNLGFGSPGRRPKT